MSVKQTALSVINALDDHADWSDVKSALKEASKKDGDDVNADITAAVVVCLAVVGFLAYWLAS
ncbi:hypothetical protein ACVBE9_02495 [Eionea flava]